MTVRPLLGPNRPHSNAGACELKPQLPHPRAVRVGRNELPFPSGIARQACEVATGAGAFEELANDVAGWVDQHAHADIDVTANFLADGAWDVWKLLVENGA